MNAVCDVTCGMFYLLNRRLLVRRWTCSIRRHLATCMQLIKLTTVIHTKKTISFHMRRKSTHSGPDTSQADRLWKATNDPLITSSRYWKKFAAVFVVF